MLQAEMSRRLFRSGAQKVIIVPRFNPIDPPGFVAGSAPFFRESCRSIFLEILQNSNGWNIPREGDG
jgi:hypothetical protein